MKITKLFPRKALNLYVALGFLIVGGFFVSFSSSASAETTFEWQGDKIVQNIDGQVTHEFSNNGQNGNLISFSNSEDGKCESHIDIEIGAGPRKGLFYQGKSETTGSPRSPGLPQCVGWNEPQIIGINNPENGSKSLNKALGLKECPDGPRGQASKNANYSCLGGGGVSNGEFNKTDKSSDQNDPNKEGQDEEKPVDNEAGCDNALAPFGWVLCPVMNIADGFYGWFKDLIGGLLFFESDKYTDNGLYDSWKTMVTIANSIIVLVAIIMIAAQIFNFEVFSAYTVKKALPRIIIAAILIQLSWFMVTTGIQVVNAIGSGLYWLLVAPFKIQSDGGGVLEIGAILGANAPDGGASDAVGNTIGLGFVTVAMAGAVAGAILTGAWLSIVLMAVGVVISLVVAVITLLLREAVLIVLIALAPIAIALWILPGTSGIWNLWWKTFSRLLLMYPLIMLLFAGGTISAILLSSSESYINYIFAIVAYFIPIFLIGATYKFAGGAFASMANFTGKMGERARSGSKGAFGLKKVADNQKASRQYNSQLRGSRLASGNSKYSRIPGAKTLGRIQAGTAGAQGAYALKFSGSEDKTMLDNANSEWSGATKGLSYGDLIAAEKNVTEKSIGDMVQIGDKDVKVTEELQRVALSSAASNKNVSVLENYARGQVSTVDQQGNTIITQKSSTERARTENAYDTFIQTDGGFGTVDALAPDLTRSDFRNKDRGKDRSELVGAQLTTSLQKFGTLKGAAYSGTDPITGKPKLASYSSRQKDVVDALAAKLNSGDMDDRRYAINAINQFSQREDLGQIDAGAVGLMGTLAGGQAQAVVSSGGNQRLALDSNGNIVLEATGK